MQRQRSLTQAAGVEVFQDPRYGTPWVDKRAFRRSYWTPALKVLGIRDRRPYNMRHTYATAMLMAGMTPALCAREDEEDDIVIFRHDFGLQSLLTARF